MINAIDKLITDGKLGFIRNVSGGLVIFNPSRAYDFDATFARVFEKITKRCGEIDTSRN